MSNHTQEPWTLIESSRLDQPNRIVSENGMPVATLYAPQKADARLISAAPELLAALQDILHETTTDVAGITRDEALNIISWVAQTANEAINKGKDA